ncbi:MAG: cryptochrome/photolyase family protein [Chitinophagales bacterium]
MKILVNIFWFRRDLRMHDQAGLYHALRSGIPVLPVFIFDRKILDLLENKSDRRVEFIHNRLTQMQGQLVHLGSSMEIFYGNPEEVFLELMGKWQINGVYTNHDYEPYARERDEMIRKKLNDAGIVFIDFKDQVIFDRDEILKEDGKPYAVFTPYSRKWKSSLDAFFLKSYPTESYFCAFLKRGPSPIPTLASIGFAEQGKPFPSAETIPELIRNYSADRDFPAKEGTSRLGIHLRFGTISIRELIRSTMELDDGFLNELIWREFYQMILWHFPRVGKGRAFKPAYDWIVWRNDESEFDAWRQGKTGYPLVDAGMRQLNLMGYMHNRVRMVTASFLTKHLLIDWRWGEAYFASKLLDFDLAANNGGWQWAAGSGCDAAPYFRVFNPTLQMEKFDPLKDYIRRWVPEYGSADYPDPIVDHVIARNRAIAVYEKALKENYPTREMG